MNVRALHRDGSTVVVAKGGQRPSDNLSVADLGTWLPQSGIEWAWWLAFAVWAFLPGSMNPLLRVADFYVPAKDLLVACLAVGSLPWLILNRRRYRRLLRWTFIPFSALAVYAVISAVAVGGLLRPGFVYIVYPVVWAWLAMTLGCSLVTSLPPSKLERFTVRLICAITLVTLVYIYTTLFPPTGLRQYVKIDEFFGRARLSGPLGLATSFPSVLVVALAYVVSITRQRRHTLFWLPLGLVLSLGIFLTLSRAAAAALIVLVLIFLLKRASLKQQFLTFSALAVAVLITLRLGSIDRLFVLTDDYRLHTYLAGISAWTESASTVVFGQGLGEVWPWYVYDIEISMGHDRWRYYFSTTPFGKVLTIPHSTFIPVLAELGLVGIVLLVLCLGSQLIPVLRSGMRQTLAALLAPGLAASLAVFMFDTLLFKYFPLSSIWWALFFVMAADYASHQAAVRREYVHLSMTSHKSADRLPVTFDHKPKGE